MNLQRLQVLDYVFIKPEMENIRFDFLIGNDSLVLMDVKYSREESDRDRLPNPWKTGLEK